MDLQTFNSDGVEVAFYEEGEGQPIVLIHGFASSAKTNWIETGWVKTLVDAGHHVIAIDNRGHGRSGKLYDPGAYTASILASDAANLINHLEIGPAAVMGYSMGARITAFLSIANPELVRVAIFAGLAENIIKGIADGEDIALGLEAASLDEVTKPQPRAFRIFAEHTGGDLNALAACMRASRQTLSESELAGIRCPVLVAAGTDDDIAGRIEPMVEALTFGEALPIPGRDHMRAVGDKVYKRGVLRFLQQHG